MLHVQELGWAAQRKLDPQEDWQLIHQHLEETGINVDGVTNQIRRRLEHVRENIVVSTCFLPYALFPSSTNQIHDACLDLSRWSTLINFSSPLDKFTAKRVWPLPFAVDG